MKRVKIPEISRYFSHVSCKHITHMRLADYKNNTEFSVTSSNGIECFSLKAIRAGANK